MSGVDLVLIKAGPRERMVSPGAGGQQVRAGMGRPVRQDSSLPLFQVIPHSAYFSGFWLLRWRVLVLSGVEKWRAAVFQASQYGLSFGNPSQP